MNIYKMEDYNVISENDKIPIIKSNSFILKINSENINMILASENKNEVNRWIKFLNN